MEEDGQFALLHDLTNCLRIGDLTIFGSGAPRLVQVKTDPNKRNAAQLRRIREAELALQHAGTLPGKDEQEHLYDIGIPLRTHLDLLATGTVQAARNGIFAAKVSGSRGLVITDLAGCAAQGLTDKSYGQRLQSKHFAALRRALSRRFYRPTTASP